MSKRQKRDGYEITPFPVMRRIIVDSGRVARRRQTMQALLEADVTEARERIREHKARTGETLSFTAFVVACLGKAVDENKAVHAYRDFWGRLVLFDEVDVGTLIEIDAGDHKFPLVHVIRAANLRSLREIHDEIRSIQTHSERSESAQKWGFMRWFLLLPPFLRGIFYSFIRKNPQLWKAQGGTVVLTAVGMFGHGSGWGIAAPIHTLGVTVGGIAEKPGVVDGQIAIREYLNLTLDFDHDIIDGAPAARFTQRFKELIETAYGLAVGEGN